MSFKLNEKDWTLRDLPAARTVAYDDAASRLDAIDASLIGSDECTKAVRAASAALREPFKVAGLALKAAASAYVQTKPSSSDALKLTEAGAGGKVHPREAGAAVTSFIEQFWRTKVVDVANQRQAKALEVAQNAVTAMQNAQRSLSIATAKATGPLATRQGGIDVDRLATIAALRDELRATYRPTGMCEQFEALVAAGDEQAEDTFVAAVLPILHDLSKLGATKLAEALELRVPMQPQADGGQVGKEQLAIGQLRRRIGEREAERAPESLKICEAALQQLRGIFALLFGTHASLLSRQEYERRYLRSTPDPLAFDPNWLAKALPANAPQS